jgi:small-conductance mechanosensitive channel
MLRVMQMEYAEILKTEDISTNEDEIMLIEKIMALTRKRKIRISVGSFLIASSMLFMQLSILILLGVIAVSATIAVLLINVSPIAMALGLYLLLHNPPIILED